MPGPPDGLPVLSRSVAGAGKAIVFELYPLVKCGIAGQGAGDEGANTMSDMPDWVRSLPGAVTVSDLDNIIVYMNDAAAAVWAARGGSSLVGSDLLACHGDRSKGMIRGLLESGGTNVYTIEKAGVRKMIYQSAWRDEAGAVAGLVELSLPLPADMPHFVRS